VGGTAVTSGIKSGACRYNANANNCLQTIHSLLVIIDLKSGYSAIFMPIGAILPGNIKKKLTSEGLF
jgi:hypothetical protein